MSTTLGERVRIAREYAKLSQKQLAKAIGVKQPTISELESGESRSTTYAVEIAMACGLSPLWLKLGIGPMTQHAA